LASGDAQTGTEELKKAEAASTVAERAEMGRKTCLFIEPILR
jgi:hypothetical protein